MVWNSGPIVTTNRETLSWRYPIINYGGQTLILRIEIIGTVHSQRRVAAFQESA